MFSSGGVEDPFIRSVVQLQTNLPFLYPKWSKLMPQQLLTNIEQLDVELFTAYCQDWNDYVIKISNIHYLLHFVY